MDNKREYTLQLIDEAIDLVRKGDAQENIISVLKDVESLI